MKRLLIILLLLIPCLCYGQSMNLLATENTYDYPQLARMSPMIVGGGVTAAGGGDPCAGTPTYIANIAGDGNSRELLTYELGQSIVGTANNLYSISVETRSITAGTVTCRIGSTTNLSSTYTDSIAITIGASTGWYEGTSSTCPTLDTGTWYVICQSAQNITIGINDVNPYADGTYRYGTPGTWTTADNVSGRDLSIRVKVAIP